MPTSDKEMQPEGESSASGLEYLNTPTPEHLTPVRGRLAYGSLILIVIALGLASRRWAYLLPDALQKNAGDGLWALMVFLLCGWLFPRKSTLWVATVALIFSIAIEFCKLYQAPWIVTIRSTTTGHLVFGSVFTWFNLVDYLIGIAFGALCETSWFVTR